MMLQCRSADRARAFDVILRLDRQHLAAGQPDEDRHGREADGDHRIGQARPEEGGKRDGDDQERQASNASVTREMTMSIQPPK